MTLIQKRPALAITLIILAIGVIGTAVEGYTFLAKPIPAPDLLIRMWVTINFTLAVISMVTVYRNLHRFEEQWTWQEAAFSRGTYLVLLAGALGYFARAFMDPTITLGTPVYTVACAFVIYGTVRPPERFEEHDLTFEDYQAAQIELDRRFADAIRKRRNS